MIAEESTSVKGCGSSLRPFASCAPIRLCDRVARGVFYLLEECEIMSLKYTCPGCGTPLGYEGLCWKCKCERERNAALAWTPEQIAEKQKT